MIDNGSTLNVLPGHMLDEMHVDELHIRPNTMIARVSEGSPRQIIITLKVKLYVESQVFLMTVQVIDILPSYNMLLGKP